MGYTTINHGAKYRKDNIVKTINKLLAKPNNYIASRECQIKTKNMNASSSVIYECNKYTNNLLKK